MHGKKKWIVNAFGELKRSTDLTEWDKKGKARRLGKWKQLRKCAVCTGFWWLVGACDTCKRMSDVMSCPSYKRVHGDYRSSPRKDHRRWERNKYRILMQRQQYDDVVPRPYNWWRIY